MQKNPGAKTIEADLEEALYHAGAVPEQDRGLSKRYDWARSARTDKGVSAVGQVVSGRFYIDPPGFVDRLNSNLSPQMRIFGYKRVTASFSAKKFCDRRRYVYLIPVFALDPNCHRDRESVKASLGSDNELVKCLECSERGRKVEGVMGKRYFDVKTTVIESDISSNTGNAIEVSEVQANGVLGDNASTSDFNKQTSVLVENSETELNVAKSEGCEMSGLGNDSETIVSKDSVNGDEKCAESFKYGKEEKARFNRILKNYVGTHNFHNFTTRMKAEDPAAHRFIISFDAATTVVVEGIEFVKCEVVGQSFMLHQIRKMMGLAVAIMRNCAPESLIEKAFQKNVNITVPTAPEVGLYLDECLFTSYNQKWKDTHEEVSMNEYKEVAEAFKMKHIYSHIASTEHKDGAVALWLHSLNHRNYPDLRVVDVDEVVDIAKNTSVNMETPTET